MISIKDKIEQQEPTMTDGLKRLMKLLNDLNSKEDAKKN